MKTENTDDRAWIELSLQDELKPSHPFRTEPGSMLGHSPYANLCNESVARFKLRTSYFLAKEIECGLDPSYDRVGSYIYLNSQDELIAKLSTYSLGLNDFIDANKTDDYPL
ncbi:hypothetical protein JHU04_002334 [Brenneria sp. 4F2]|nr:hypothetical protein [Brenneria bubanii]